MFSSLRRDILKTIIMQNCTFLKDLGLKKHKLCFIAVGCFVDKMTGGKQDQRFESLLSLVVQTRQMINA